jgi:DNA-binding MarR family transcriptional regulator
LTVPSGRSLEERRAPGRKKTIRLALRLNEKSLGDMPTKSATRAICGTSRSIGNLFGEPAWDILLTLYVIDADQRRLSTRDLSKHANLALTTALRWLDYLEEQDLITRKTNTFDRRVVYVEISHKGRAAMDHYLAEMHDATVSAEGATNP